jgi:hypothetical protein
MISASKYLTINIEFNCIRKSKRFVDLYWQRVNELFETKIKITDDTHRKIYEFND